MKIIIKISTAGFLILGLTSCKKFVQVSPPVTALVGSSVYSTNSTAAAAVSGIYLTMAGNSVGGNSYGISALLGLSADEFTLYPNSDQILNETYTNSLLGTTPVPPEWDDLYNCIYQANSALEGISASSGVTAAMKQQLMGEAEFVRAFCDFYLLNIYGNVPNITSSNYVTNQTVSQSSQENVYQQIVADLTNAQNLLGDNFLAPDGTPTSERVRPNKGAATALLARVYLYEQKWDSAEMEATAVINNPNYNLVTTLDSAFLANNSEAIWQLEVPDNGFNAPDGFFLLGFLYYGGPNSEAPFILNDSLVNSFEPGDLRRTNWVDSVTMGSTVYYFPYKYQLYYTGAPPVEYPTVFRLAEQYLIRAEARAEQDNLIGSAEDLDVIRARAGLPATASTTEQDLLNSIYHERRCELFTEYGNRWLDLRRTGNLNAVMSVVTPEKGGAWDLNDQWYPIPLSEIQADENLKQNPGYN